MKTFSTRQAAKRLGIHFATLAQHLAAGRLPAPKIVEVSGVTIHAWTEREIECARKLLPKIANGRKTRYQKLRDKQKPPAGVPVPHKQKRRKKKK